MTTETPQGAIRPIGLRGRLLLAFVGISMFAVVAGLSGQYAFDAVTKAFDRTGATIPPALAAVELTRETEQVLSAGPRMMNAATEEEVEGLSRLAASDLSNVGRLVDQLRSATIDPKVLQDLLSNVARLRDNLAHLKTAAGERVQAANRRERLTIDTFAAYREFGTAWNRNFADLQGQVLQLRNSLSQASTPQERGSPSTVSNWPSPRCCRWSRSNAKPVWCSNSPRAVHPPRTASCCKAKRARRAAQHVPSKVGSTISSGSLRPVWRSRCAA